MSFRASALYIQDTVPKSVSRIGEYAFRDCHNLLNVYCYAEKVSETGTNIFMESNIKNAILHVPWFYIPDYEKTSPWSGFGKIVALTPWETGIDELKGENGKRELPSTTSPAAVYRRHRRVSASRMARWCWLGKHLPIID